MIGKDAKFTRKLEAKISRLLKISKFDRIIEMAEEKPKISVKISSKLT